jgi:hypothetical protein
MTDLSREELRAHLSAVEAQVRAALRIVAAESKSVQQAHSALRADLSAALIRLQSEMNDGNKRVDGKVERVISEVNGLSRQRRLTAAILTTLVLLFGITLGLFAGGGWYLISQGDRAGIQGVDQQPRRRDLATGAGIERLDPGSDHRSERGRVRRRRIRAPHLVDRVGAGLLPDSRGPKRNAHRPFPPSVGITAPVAGTEARAGLTETREKP